MPALSASVTRWHTHTHTESTFHPPYPKQPIELAGICDPNPYFNFPPLMQTNSILVAFPHKRSAMWEMSFFSCCIYKKSNQRHFWVGLCLCQLCPSRPAYRQNLGSNIWGRTLSALQHSPPHRVDKCDHFSSRVLNSGSSQDTLAVFKTHILHRARAQTQTQYLIIELTVGCQSNRRYRCDTH